MKKIIDALSIEYSFWLSGNSFWKYLAPQKLIAYPPKNLNEAAAHRTKNSLFFKTVLESFNILMMAEPDLLSSCIAFLLAGLLKYPRIGSLIKKVRKVTTTEIHPKSL